MDVERPGVDRKVRKRKFGQFSRACQRRGVYPPGPWRWVHGVLYDANGVELVRLSSGSLGVDGLAAKNQWHTRQHYRQPKPAPRPALVSSRPSWL